MAAITSDTSTFANKLKSAGVVPEHAEAEALAELFEINLKEVATKEDIKERARNNLGNLNPLTPTLSQRERE